MVLINLAIANYYVINLLYDNLAFPFMYSYNVNFHRCNYAVRSLHSSRSYASRT